MLDEIKTERERQDAKWGAQNHTNAHWLAILMEEVGEVAERVCKSEIPPLDRTCYENRRLMREELIQVAAVAVAWIEAYDRREEGGAK